LEAKFDLSNSRKTFSKIPSFIDVPDLLSIQTKAYQQFLQEWVPYEARDPIGLEGVFKDVFPIEDSHKNYILEELIQKISFKKVINMGSIGCKIASIMRGESDIYISLSLPGKSSPKDWDLAAPASLLKAFGGAITNLNNQELSYNKANYEQGGIIVATNNKDFHKKICCELREIIEKYDLYPINI